MNLATYIKRGAAAEKSGGLQVGVGGFGGMRSWFYGLLPGAKLDYQRLAGNPWKNSIVAASVQWVGRNLPQAPFAIYRRDPQGQEKIDKSHPLAKLLARPSKYLSGRDLRTATMLSLIVSGNAYWYIVRGNGGAPVELWYIPHFQIAPIPGNSTIDWVTGYEYVVGGKKQTLAYEDVIHFRDGIDPEYPWKGLSPLASAFRLLVTDNECDGYSASLIRNMGIPGAIITPKNADQVFGHPEMDLLKTQYEESVSGDNRGRPMVLTGPVDVKTLALSPEQLLLNTAQDKPEERVSALIGIPVGVLQLGVGLENSTYNNREADREAAWVEGIIPRNDIICNALDIQLLPLFGNAASERVGCDYSTVKALQESQDDLFDRLSTAVGGPFITPNEARAQVGLANLADKDVLYPPKVGTTPKPDDGDASVSDESVKSALAAKWRARQRLLTHGR